MTISAERYEELRETQRDGIMLDSEELRQINEYERKGREVGGEVIFRTLASVRIVSYARERSDTLSRPSVLFTFGNDLPESNYDSELHVIFPKDDAGAMDARKTFAGLMEQPGAVEIIFRRAT